MTKQADLSIGEDWAYRQRGVDPLTCVVVTRIGTRRPPRVRVRFLEDDFEGIEEWVSPNRLKARWDERAVFLEREQRFAALLQRSPASSWDPELLAAGAVFEAACAPEILTAGYGPRRGFLLVHDRRAAAQAFGVEEEVFCADPLAFVDEDGTLLAPWDVTLELARGLAPRFAEKILGEVRSDEAKAASEVLFGHVWLGRRGAEDVFSPLRLAPRPTPNSSPCGPSCGSGAGPRPPSDATSY